MSRFTRIRAACCHRRCDWCEGQHGSQTRATHEGSGCLPIDRDHVRSKQPTSISPPPISPTTMRPPLPLRWGWQRRALSLSPLPLPLRLSTLSTLARPQAQPQIGVSSRPRLHPPLSLTLAALGSVRAFHASPPRGDILFLSMPALKSTLLGITRFSLLALPFVWRYKYAL